MMKCRNAEMFHVGGVKLIFLHQSRYCEEKLCKEIVKADTMRSRNFKQIQQLNILLTLVGVLKLICMVTGVEYTALRRFLG